MRVEPRFVIYGLAEPTTGELRYVGKSTTGARQRLMSHLCPSSLRDPTHKNRWISSLLAKGVRPEVFVIEACDTKDALNEAEQHHIAAFRSLGCRLTNLTPGGDGHAGRVWTPEYRSKMSIALTGRRCGSWSEERKAKQSQMSKGRKRSASAVEKTAAALRGKPRPPHVVEAMRAGALKQWASTEARVEQSRRKGGRPFVDQHGVRYETQQEAARVLGLLASKISNVLNGKRRHTRGYVFTFIEEH